MSRSKVDTPAKIDAILARIPTLPDSAVVPIAVAAAHDNVCRTPFDATIRAFN
jgi:hypothetical protein